MLANQVWRQQTLRLRVLSGATHSKSRVHPVRKGVAIWHLSGYQTTCWTSLAVSRLLRAGKQLQPALLGRRRVAQFTATLARRLQTYPYHLQKWTRIFGQVLTL
jgi:hypothetical protein